MNNRFIWSALKMLLKRIYRYRSSGLSSSDIAGICEAWISNVSIRDIAKRYNRNEQVISSIITKDYLGTTLNATYSITIPSKMNRDDFEQKLNN